MSNCCQILQGSSLAFTPNEIKIDEFKAALDNAKEHSFEWWFLQTNTEFSDAGVVILLGCGRSMHTFRDLKGVMHVIGTFLKARKRFKMKLLDVENNEWHWTFFYEGPCNTSDLSFRVEEFKSSIKWLSPLCWRAHVFDDSVSPPRKIAESETSYTSPLHALLCAIDDVNGGYGHVDGMRSTFKEKEVTFRVVDHVGELKNTPTS